MLRVSPLIVWLLVAILAAVAPSATEATTVISVREKCPACGEESIGRELGSWFQFQEPARDFAGTMRSASITVHTCPQCLYSALSFKPLSAAQRKRVLAALKRLPEGLAEVERPPGAAPPAGKVRDASRVEGDMQLHLAEFCAARTDADPRQRVDLAMAAYYRAAPGAPKRVATHRAIAALQAMIVDEDVAKGDPDSVYLLGELQRRAGKTKEAAATLSLAAKLGASAKDGNLVRWANEQKRLAERGVSEPRDPASNDGDDAEKELAKQLKRRLPDFIAALQQGKPSRAWLLPEKDKRDPVHETMNVANKLVEKGNAQAVEYVLRWLAQIDRAELDDYPEPYCLQALAHQPALAAPILTNLKFRYERLADATRYACGASPAPEVTFAALRGKSKWLPSDEGVLMAAKVRRDPAFKAPLLRSDCKNWPMSVAAAYLGEMATPEDLPVLETRSKSTGHPKDVGEWDPRTAKREELEGVILTVRLRALAAALK